MFTVSSEAHKQFVPPIMSEVPLKNHFSFVLLILKMLLQISEITFFELSLYYFNIYREALLQFQRHL